MMVKRKSASVLSFTAFLAFSCGVCGLLLLSGGKERRVVLEESGWGKEKKKWKTKNTNPIATLKKPQLTLTD